MTNTEWIHKTIKENSLDVCFLETISMWICNPTSKSASYGKEDFWKAVYENLQHRHKSNEIKNGVSTARKLVNYALNDLDGEELKDLLDDCLLEFGESKLYNLLMNSIVQDSTLRGHVFVLARYLKDSDLWDYYLSGGDKRNINARINHDFADNPDYSFDDFIEQGFIYKLPWKKTGIVKSVTTEYILPRHSTRVIHMVLNDPSLNVPYYCEFCSMDFRSLDSLAKHTHICLEKDPVLETEPFTQPFETDDSIPFCSKASCGSVKLIERGEGSGMGRNILNAIIQSAEEYIQLEDNFLGLSTINALLCSKESVRIKILTSLYNERQDRDGRNIPTYATIARVLKNLGHSSDRFEIKETGGSWTHDRVLLTEKFGWGFSTSLKDIVDDEKWSLISHLPQVVKNYIQSDFEVLWGESFKVTHITYEDLYRRRGRPSRS